MLKHVLVHDQLRELRLSSPVCHQGRRCTETPTVEPSMYTEMCMCDVFFGKGEKFSKKYIIGHSILAQPISTYVYQ